MKIENAQKDFFETKETYKSFVDAWKDYHANDKHRKTECKGYDGHTYRESDLQCVHHLIYAALRGKDISKMFAPTNKHVGQGKYFAYEQARQGLYYMLHYGARKQWILDPFAGTIDESTIKQLYETLKGMNL